MVDRKRKKEGKKTMPKSTVKSTAKKITKRLPEIANKIRNSQASSKVARASKATKVEVDEKTAKRKALTLKAFNAAYETHNSQP